MLEVIWVYCWEVAFRESLKQYLIWMFKKKFKTNNQPQQSKKKNIYLSSITITLKRNNQDE